MEIVKNKILKYKNYYWKIWKETALLIVNNYPFFRKIFNYFSIIIFIRIVKWTNQDKYWTRIIFINNILFAYRIKMKFKFIFQYTSHFSLIPTYVFINILDKFYISFCTLLIKCLESIIYCLKSKNRNKI